MVQKMISKEKISDLIKELQEEFKVFGPVREEGVVLFKEITDAKEIYLDYSNSKIPAKSVLFPMIDTLFSYKKEGKGVKIIENPPYEKTIILGIRPCDSMGFSLFKNFFSFGKYKDPLVLNRLENITLIGMGCLEPRTTCFCTSVNGGPFNKESVDVLITEFKDNYYLESSTDKGEALIKKIKSLTDADKGDLAKIEKLQKDIESAIPVIEGLDSIYTKLDGLFDHPMWKMESQGCIGCGACTYLCPTCHCFDVLDENKQDGSGRRIRIWDTCQFPLFTLETSGHNPRTTKLPRVRQRIFHKFNYYPKNYNIIGCVGCGRCIINCPVSSDIRNIFISVENISSKTEG